MNISTQSGLRVAAMTSIRCIATAAMVLQPGIAAAQTTGGAPVTGPRLLRIIVAYPPGGAPDTLARTLAQKVTEGRQYNVVIDNRPGAAGGVAAEALKAAPADGSVVALFDSSTTAILPSLRGAKNSYDTLRDFRAVGRVATSPIFLVARADLATTVPELIAALKAKPGQPYGSSGNGSAHHLAMEMFKARTGTELLHIPYKGSSQTVPAVAAGDVTITFAGITNARPFVQTGKVRVLATAEPTRSPSAPEVPTLAEAGVKGFAMTITLGVFAPSGTPEHVIRTLNAEFTKAATSEDVKSKLSFLGIDASASTPEAFSALIAAELKSYAEIIKTANVKDE